MTSPQTPTEALEEAIKRTVEVQAAAKATGADLRAEEAGIEEAEETPEVETTPRPTLGR